MSATAPPERRLLRAPALRSALAFGAPTLVILVLAMLPVITGSETLVLRDVLESHLMLEAPRAEALRSGELPVLDVHRGGEPLLGNPNALPFYPSRVLYAVAPVLWALNAHFWLHWLLAPLAGYALGRAWELGRPASWAVGVCFATSGYFLSQLNLYNLVAGAALVPALVAATLLATTDGRARGPAAATAGLLWGLILLSGDPTPVLAGALLAAGAVVVRAPRSLLRPLSLGPLAGAVALGTLVALPQVVETLRILPSTYRGYQGYSGAGGGLTPGTWHPAHAIEWLVPLPFGRFDLRAAGAFWGESLFGGELPLLLSLYPGSLALALVAAAGLPKFRSGCRRTGWAWGMAALGIVLATGGLHPLGRWLLELPGGHLFRYPVKLWPLVAVAAALLCGVGWQRTFGGSGPGWAPGEAAGLRRARLAWPLAAIGGLLVAVLAILVAAPGVLDQVTSAYGPERWSPALAAAERGRWLASTVLALALVGVHLVLLLLARRRTALAMALLLAVHAAGQVHFLRPLLLTDDAGLYGKPSPLVARVPRGARVAHAGYAELFGAETVHAGFDNRALWAVRQDFASGIPPAGILNGGLRYELAPSPEGLSSFLGRVSRSAVAAGPSDADRVRALSRWGVEYLFSEEPLVGVSSELAEGVGLPGVTDPVFVYRLARPAPEVILADLPVRVPHLNAGWELFRSPGFDPGRHVVLPPQSATAAAGGDRTPALPVASGSTPGRLRVLRRGDEVLEVETASPVPAVLVFQRAVQPVWRATVDGEPVAIEPANLYRIGVPVPAGRHRVLLRVDRGPLRLALAASAAGLLGLAALAVVPGALRRRREAVEVEGAAEDV